MEGSEQPGAMRRYHRKRRLIGRFYVGPFSAEHEVSEIDSGGGVLRVNPHRRVICLLRVIGSEKVIGQQVA